MLKAYWCDECDLYAAESAEQAAELWRDMVGADESLEEGYPRELTDQELDALQPEFDEDERRTGGTTSIRRMLAEHGDEPGWLAGTEW